MLRSKNLQKNRVVTCLKHFLMESPNAEFDLWASTMANIPKPYDDVKVTLNNSNKELSPQIHHLLRLVCTFSITTCETQ